MVRNDVPVRRRPLPYEPGAQPQRNAVAVEAILPAITSPCGNWTYRRTTARDLDGEELVSRIVSEANALTVEIYDIHPFLDGNTRTTWHLRNYLLMYDGLRPLIDLSDQSEYEGAWWAATPHDHAQLDAIVLRQLAAEDQ